MYTALGDGTYRMSLSDDFAEDVNSMWDLCRTDPAQWNMNLNALELLSHYKMQDDGIAFARRIFLTVS